VGLDAGTLAKEKRRVPAPHAEKRREQRGAQGGPRGRREAQRVGVALPVGTPQLGGRGTPAVRMEPSCVEAVGVLLI